MKRTHWILSGAATAALAAVVLWPDSEPEDKASEGDAEQVQLRPKSEDPAYQRLQAAQKAKLLPVADPEKRRQAWEQAVEETKATIEAEERARDELQTDEVPERLRELNPKAAAQLERNHEIHQEWQEHHRDKLEQLRDLEPAIPSEN